MAKKKKAKEYYISTDSDTPQKNVQARLWKAIRIGDKNDVKLFLEYKSVEPDAKDLHGRTVLSLAAEHGHEGIVKLLLKLDGIDVDSTDNDSQTPLFRAATRGHHQVVKLLIEEGNANPNLVDGNDQTPLLAAMKQLDNQGPPWPPAEEAYAVIKLLLLYDCVNLEYRNRLGQTALSLAAENGQLDLVRLLLEQDGVNPDSMDNDNRTPLSRASERGHDQVVELLVNDGRVNLESRDKAGRTPLSWAVMYSNKPKNMWGFETENHKAVEVLLKHSEVDPTTRDNEGRTPLSWAVEHPPPKSSNTHEVVDLLLAQPSITLYSKDIYGRTPLSRAAESGQQVVMKRLLEEHGVNPDFKDEDGRTPLSQAAQHGREAVVHLLLAQSSVDADSKDEHDRTPLWWAAEAGRKRVVSLLLTRDDVDAESVDDEGLTPISRAAETGNEAIMDFFKEKDKIALHILARRGSLGPLQLLLGMKYDVEIKDIHGRTPLHAAALSGHADVARELISKEAHVDCKDTNGMTPLHVAIRHKRQEVIHVLLENSAQTTGILCAEWLEAYNQKRSDVVIEFSQTLLGKISLQFIEKQRFRMPNAPGLTRRISLFSDHPTWSKHLACKLKDGLQIDASHILHEIKIYQKHVSVSIVGAFPELQDRCAEALWSKHGISWTMVPPSKPKDGSCWKSMDHFGTLPYGWIPEDGADFFTLFIQNLKEHWLILCLLAEERLSQRRLDQLHARGNSAELIHHLAEDAQEWAHLRKVLNGQVVTARAFVTEYCRSYDQDGGARTMHSSIDRFSTDTTTQINQLDQTVKDLLQFEFAWVSINEAHRSTSIATSIKRLSWITFIFLPVMFASSLFGMNVDILETNPDWRWSLLFGGGCLALTFLVWLLAKYGQVESLFDGQFGLRVALWSRKGSGKYRLRLPTDARALPA